MGLFGFFGGRGSGESAVLIDVGTHTVAGAYAHVAKAGDAPTIVYEKSVQVEFREGELQEQAMLRALRTLGEMLLREGAPALARVSGSGRAGDIIVSINAPWQKTSVRSEYLEEKKPFVFTKHLVDAVIEKTSVKPPGKLMVNESVIGTILNGYVTADPFGKEAHRAEIVIVTSIIDEPVANAIIEVLRGLYHTRHIKSIAGNSLRYQAMRAAFPHERDALIVDVTGPLSSIALIRKDLLMTIVQIGDGLATVEAWIQQVITELIEVSRRFPLPRTIFLLAREPEVAPLQKALSSANLGELWLSENQPTVVPVQASHLATLVRRTSAGTPDLLMLLMALYWRQQASK